MSKVIMLFVVAVLITTDVAQSEIKIQKRVITIIVPTDTCIVISGEETDEDKDKESPLLDAIEAL